MKSSTDLTFRSHRPGDMGLMVYRQALFYSKEYGWNETFEASLARITADFIDNFDPAKDRCWIAEKGGQFMGCVALVKHPDHEDAAKLRLLFVDENSRGLGLGSKLVNECIEFARKAGYKSMWLMTQSCLVGARKIYTQAGFKLAESIDHESWGAKLTEEHWKLNL